MMGERLGWGLWVAHQLLTAAPRSPGFQQKKDLFGLRCSEYLPGWMEGRHAEAAQVVLVGTLVETPHVLEDWEIQQEPGAKDNLPRPVSRDLLSTARSNLLMVL